ncbi:MAG: UDP-N-acetylmuramoyl-tripeptide--D-alanyl-D-alanine ligase [Calditrichaeota bacterium]|nr:UDP-N-acetylmuramoyl-tripeptide--D-alanyl-D-alanine ligase [Calditrichota bacterium]
MESFLSYLKVIWILLPFAAWVFSNSYSQKRTLHILQLEDYIPSRMLRSSGKKSLQTLFDLDLIGLVLISIYAYRMVCSADGTCGCRLVGFYDELGIFFWTIGCAYRSFSIGRSLKTSKKKLVLTPRARRIYWTGIIISFFIAARLVVIIYEIGSSKGIPSIIDSELGFLYFHAWILASMFVIERASPLILSLSVFVLKPVESFIQKRYLRDAKRILGEIKPLVIGITGSYGKTGTKEILAAILAEKYNVFKPPGSYNTLMGVTRIIREKMRPYHEVFVAEMGAYKIGSINKLCELVNPTHGIITIIGLQHLERFKTQKAIQQAKGELIRSLPANGLAILNGSDPLCREIGDAHNGRVIYFYVEKDESDAPVDKASVSARNIHLSPVGSDFTISFTDGEELEIHLPLLGRPAIANAVASAAMAEQLGVPKRGIKRALASMPQVQHRLEAKPGEGGVRIIDDAFNSNPIGAASALEVLSQATDGLRILVTPGMVELGEMESEANYKFGKQAAVACDLAVLVGVNRVEPIRKGLLDGGFDEEKIWVVSTLNEGLDKLKGYLQPGDTMLLENDLPDQYDNQ